MDPDGIESPDDAHVHASCSKEGLQRVTTTLSDALPSIVTKEKAIKQKNMQKENSGLIMLHELIINLEPIDAEAREHLRDSWCGLSPAPPLYSLATDLMTPEKAADFERGATQSYLAPSDVEGAGAGDGFAGISARKAFRIPGANFFLMNS